MKQSPMSTFTNRKASYKQPPGILTDRTISQNARRAKALEEQKRRRAKRIEAERHIDLFADLNLGPSDDEIDERGENDKSSAGDGDAIVREGVGQFVSLLQPGASSTSASKIDATVEEPTKKQKKKKGRPAQSKSKTKKPSPWADKCMYAELLEVKETDVWDSGGAEEHDGLPEDLQTGWVAVAPVPVGKRCLAVSHYGSGVVGVVANTTLRSRVLGRPLMPRFPSPLPSDTVLDCILDQNWRENGVIHVLDVLKWKSQDVADCETSFRFWWRDTRLSELPPPQPPTTVAPVSPTSPRNAASTEGPQYHFPYPTAFLPIAYHTDTTASNLLSHVIPRARSAYTVTISVPAAPHDGGAAMDVELPQPAVREEGTEIKSDGLLLYVAQAIYEPGTSPLSSWVPLVPYRDELEKGRVEGNSDMDGVDVGMGVGKPASPLDVFERLVRRRVGAQQGSIDVPMAL
ncbi:hypothetical protein EW146_g1569 [Bondarzewia mesenterica]|uniref:Snurportin-1 n=1 Tax=Bondarzewia mesenterica TaxID=1095465 RepID=A0A4S4M3J6_9AGAM|nr:hypothetical protein EW146_g1569 [Bondarzewia mesenterica]